MDFGDCTTCITVPWAKSVFSGRNGIGTPRQRGDCAIVSGLSFAPCAPTPVPPPKGFLGAVAPGASGGIFPSGGSMIIDVRLPVFKTELKTALYAPLTSWDLSADRALRPGFNPLFSSDAATSWSVKNSLPAFAAERSRGTSANTNHVPCRSASPHGVRGGVPAFEAPVALAPVDLVVGAGVWPVIETAAKHTSPIPASALRGIRYRSLMAASTRLQAASRFHGIHTRPLHFVRRPSARRSEEELLAIRQREVPAVCAVRPVLRLITVDYNLLPHLQRVPSDAAPQQDVWTSSFHCPVLRRAVGHLHVHMNPTVWIDEFDLRHGCIRKMDRLVRVEF